MKKRVAIVYDRVNKWGGAERVLLALHEMFPTAPLYTSVYDKKKAPWAKVFPRVYTSFLQNIPLAKGNHEFLGTLMPFAFMSFDLSDYNLVISVTSEAAKGVRVGQKALHVCYCLTPTRYLWSHHDIYFRDPVLYLFSRPAVWFLRWWDRTAAQKPQKIIGISTVVKNRIEKYYKRNADVIFPPVKIGGLKKKLRRKKGKYYLLVSRLDFGYKRVELAVEVFNKLGDKLVIIGTGRERKKLERMANKNIKFAGAVSEKKLIEYYRGAKALIMPQEEDFGIVAVEAQVYGVPVIAYKKGGALDTVIPGKTGLFFEEQKPESLVKAVKKFEKTKFVVDNLYANAKRFSKENFRKEIEDLI